MTDTQKLERLDFLSSLSYSAHTIDRMIKDHIMGTDIWDSEHFCNAYWNITLHLQPYKD